MQCSIAPVYRNPKKKPMLPIVTQKVKWFQGWPKTPIHQKLVLLMTKENPVSSTQLSPYTFQSDDGLSWVHQHRVSTGLSCIGDGPLLRTEHSHLLTVKS